MTTPGPAAGEPTAATPPAVTPPAATPRAAASRPRRADASRNRAKLLEAADHVFAEHGLDAPLEEIARRAGTSIGTLYNHFPTRTALYDAVLPARVSRLDQIGARAMAEPDAWTAFASYLTGLFDVLAQDRALNETLARSDLLTESVAAACKEGLVQVEELVRRAKAAGTLRPDFERSDLTAFIPALSHAIREMPTSDAWRRCLGYFLDGLHVPGGPQAGRP
ncbi:TetR/AcrR family transcriptional regulator [Catenulispora yoronensis]|uniref:TetR/AcrR family transcriptional regulator n=1 Tax=Catenulispora yoronensis TaxID=450799 RepID=UPI0031E44FD0